MSQTRKIAAILVADVVGYSRLARADEERTLARLRALSTTAESSRAPGTGSSLNSAAWSTRRVARLKCRPE
jgi:hypothetical protein